MLTDTVFIASVVTVVAVCVVLGFLGRYAYKHIQIDAALQKAEANQKPKQGA